MSKHLYIGDPHATIGNLTDSEKLFQFVLETAIKEEVNKIVLLGDLYHNHAIKRVEIEEFWDRWLEKLSLSFETIVLCGNHDMVNQKDHNSKNALEVHRHIADSHANLVIVTKPKIINGIAYVPYIHDQERFIKTVNTMNTRVLVCHQSFDGSQYDNGTYDPNGFDSTLINQEQIISGHIHGEATFSKIWHPGTSKWDTDSDANKTKQIWICEHDDKTGLMTSKTPYSTWGIVTPIVSFKWTEGQPQPELPERAVISIEIIGSQSFVNKGKELFKGKAKIQTKITDRVVRENRKASASVLDFLEKVYKTSINKDKLKKYLMEKNCV